MHLIETWLVTFPPIAVYLSVALVIGVESMGLPVPGEITLVAAALLSVTGPTNPWGVALAATLGAVAGDSLGYTVGRRGGHALLTRLAERFPRHLGPGQLRRAEDAFQRWGVRAVFFGRFIAILRIVAGPLAGALRVPYRRFLLANASGGALWAFGTTFATFSLGQAAERWLSSFAWVALAVAVAAGAVTAFVVRARSARHVLGGDDTLLVQPDGVVLHQDGAFPPG